MRSTRGEMKSGAFLVLALAAIMLVTVGCRSSGVTSSDALRASGTIEAEQVRVAPETGGKVIDLLVEEGALVELDQVLGRLDAALLQAQRDQARSAMEGAQGAIDAAQAQLAGARAARAPRRSLRGAALLPPRKRE